MSSEVGQQHPLGIYWAVWGGLFVVSGLSYWTDYLQDGLLRWGLILLFMFVKAGYIVAVFMHLKYERWALIYALLLPPGALLVLVGLMWMESDYTWLTRVQYFDAPLNPEPAPVVHPE